MRGLWASTLGGILIFSVQQLAPLLSPINIEVVTGQDREGDPDFALLLSRWSWWAITFQDAPDIAKLSDRARAMLFPVVTTALDGVGLHCDRGWVLTDTFELSEPHRIGVAGHCLQATRT